VQRKTGKAAKAPAAEPAPEADAYDPSRPATIHNPYPRRLWPIKEGELAWYVVSRCVVGAPYLALGRVRWYNPDTHGTGGPEGKGEPSYTLDVVEGDSGSAQVAVASDVAPHTPDGKRKLLLKMAKTLDQVERGFRNAAEKAHLRAMKLREEAGRQLNPPRSRK
jgi:hypothetical protein